MEKMTWGDWAGAGPEAGWAGLEGNRSEKPCQLWEQNQRKRMGCQKSLGQSETCGLQNQFQILI
jgi:hypothetical protein